MALACMSLDNPVAGAAGDPVVRPAKVYQARTLYLPRFGGADCARPVWGGQGAGLSSSRAVIAGACRPRDDGVPVASGLSSRSTWTCSPVTRPSGAPPRGA